MVSFVVIFFGWIPATETPPNVLKTAYDKAAMTIQKNCSINIKGEKVMKRVIPLFLLFAILLAGCSKDDPIADPLLPLPPKIDGTWVGVVANGLEMALQIQEDHTAVSGLGAFIVTGGTTLQGSVTGTDTYPNVSISFGAPGYQPVAITGQFLSTTTITAELNQSGFDHVQVTFYKQE